MNVVNTRIKLPEGFFDVDLEIFDKNDLPQLKQIYQKWIDLSDSLQAIGGRRINLPEALSEAIFCINFNAGRLNEAISKANKMAPVCKVHVDRSRLGSCAQVDSSGAKRHLALSFSYVFS